jgi:hypothetical protein
LNGPWQEIELVAKVEILPMGRVKVEEVGEGFEAVELLGRRSGVSLG